MSNLCAAADCAKNALNKVVCEAVAVAALDFYAQVVEFIKQQTGVDPLIVFQAIAALAVLCWIQEWILELINLIAKVPRFIKNLFCGKLDLCLLNCGPKPRPEHSSSTTTSRSSSTSSSFDY